jgi:hypothetical protein
MMNLTNLLQAAQHERMTRDEVVKRFCRLATRVASEHFDSMEASDCFCESPDNSELKRAVFAPLGMDDYRFSERILTFIEEAVDTAMRESK